jgi:hypothetical protein
MGVFCGQRGPKADSPALFVELLWGARRSSEAISCATTHYDTALQREFSRLAALGNPLAGLISGSCPGQTARMRRETSPELPPIVPSERVALDRAIILLGNRVKGELRQSIRSELVGLVGRYPDPTTAQKWKTSLKSIRDDEIFDCTG